MVAAHASPGKFPELDKGKAKDKAAAGTGYSGRAPALTNIRESFPKVPKAKPRTKPQPEPATAAGHPH